FVNVDAVPFDEHSFLRAIYDASMEPPIWVERVTPSKPPQADLDSEIEMLWSYGRPSSLTTIKIASAPETFAVAVSFNNPYTPCDASLEWPSRGLVYKPPPCDVIQHMLFHPNGTMLSLWADRENEVWKLLTWAPDEEAPSEVAQGELPPLDARLAGLALR